MQIPGAIPVTGFIGPTDSNDTYAVTDALYGVDGYRSVSGITVRNAITQERRREGMLVYTQNDNNVWQLLEGPWTFTDSDWKLFISSAATASLSGNTGFLSLSGGTVSGNTNFTLNLSATTYYSGSTPLQTILNMFSGSTGSGGFTGGTVTGNTVFATGVTANTLTLNTATLAPLNTNIFTVDPSPLNNGDMWVSSGISGVFLNVRVAGVTKSVELA